MYDARMDALQSAFIAIPLEGVAKEAFQELQGRLRPWESFLRFQSAETPHLTLYFWKELSPIEHTQALAQFSKIAACTEPFALSINDVETFGSKEGDRVLYLSVAFSPELAVLKKKCPWANGPDNPFHPHITLAFIEHPQRFLVEKKKIFKTLGHVDITLPVDRFRFYAQIDGKKQTPIEQYLLGK